VDYSKLTSLGISINRAQVEALQGDSTPIFLGYTDVYDPAGGPWSLSLIGEASAPVRLVLTVNTDGGYIYDEISTTVADQSGLDFSPGPIGAGTSITGKGLGNYWYLFVPDNTGTYAFTVNSPGTSPQLYDVWGGMSFLPGFFTTSAPERSTISSLTCKAPFRISNSRWTRQV
jgi:hypothetical protein